LGSLESHYDSSVIASQTLLYSARAMDTQGRSAVGGLVKGAICGVVGGTALLIEEIVSSFYKNPDQWNERMMTVESAFSTMWAEVYRWAEVHGLVFDDLPNQILSWDYVLLVLIVVGLAVLLFGAALYAMLSILRVAGKTWLYLTAAFGAAVGVLIVPLMADLSEDWVEKTPAWRWAITLVWLAIPVVTLLALLGETGSRKTAGAAALLATLVVVWCSTPFTWLVERMIIRPVKWAAQKAENLSTWVYKKLGWTVAKEPVDEKYAPHKQFICSGLVQDALVKTAAALKVPAEDVIANLAEWEENKKSPAAQESVLKNTLPKDFAASDKFRWTYLYVDGALTPKPSESHKAEASTDSLKEIKGRKLCLKAAWSLRVALLGLYVTVIYGWTHDLHGIEPPWSLLILGGLCGLLALLLASLARRELALRPKEIRGRALKNWGGVLGAVALLIVLVQGGLLATMATPPEAWLEVVWVMPLVIAVAAVALFVF
jgi:MFS family permease